MIDGARVLSVRTPPYGFKRRRYQLADGRHITGKPEKPRPSGRGG